MSDLPSFREIFPRAAPAFAKVFSRARFPARVFVALLLLSGPAGMRWVLGAARATPADLSANPDDVRAPLGLPRLKTKSKPGKAAPLASSAYDLDPLAVPPVAKTAGGICPVQRNGVRVLELDAAHEWKRPLLKSGKGPLCVSFLLYGSDATVIAIDGAWLGVARSPVSQCLQLMIGESTPEGPKWREAGLHVQCQTYGGGEMAPFPVLTVRLDPGAEVWDLYAGPRQLADNISLPKTKGGETPPDHFLVRAGQGKTWLCGLVQTTDNPLFEDSNGNGIDDDFERSKKGALLPANLPVAQRAATAKEWRDSATARPPEAWRVEKPRPD
jgi:hypothetical protein